MVLEAQTSMRDNALLQTAGTVPGTRILEVQESWGRDENEDPSRRTNDNGGGGA